MVSRSRRYPQLEIRKEDVRQVLEGYVKPSQQAIAVSAIGDTGLNARLFWVFYLRSLTASLARARLHQAVRYFQDTCAVVMEASRMAWATEILRVMDHSTSCVDGKRRDNLTIALCHDRFRRCEELGLAEKKEEGHLYGALHDYYTVERFREFRNQQMFHLDLTTMLHAPVLSGDLDRLTTLIHDWYRFTATVIVGAEPTYVTREARARGQEQARVLRRLMLDGLRWQRAKGPPWSARDYTRYGFYSGMWIDHLSER